MAHETTLNKYTTDNGDKIVSFKHHYDDGSHEDVDRFIFRNSIKRIVAGVRARPSSSHDHVKTFRVEFYFGDGLTASEDMSEDRLEEILVFFYGKEFADGYVPGETTEVPHEHKDETTEVAEVPVAIKKALPVFHSFKVFKSANGEYIMYGYTQDTLSTCRLSLTGFRFMCLHTDNSDPDNQTHEIEFTFDGGHSTTIPCMRQNFNEIGDVISGRIPAEPIVNSLAEAT